MAESSEFKLICPTDFRYPVADLEGFLTEDAFTKYKLRVEIALVKTLAKHGLCPRKVAAEIEKATRSVTTKEVYEEENRIKHDIRALVNAIRGKVSNKAKPYVHATATSFDIVDTANALRFKDAAVDVILPDMVSLEKTWVEVARREKNTIQIGRTHGQHAEPITFGFALASYVDRWGGRILKVKEAAGSLVGKFSGAVGAYNASSLLIKNPEGFELDLLKELGLPPARISTQIVPPEPTSDFVDSIISSFGVLANFADDMRHLQRTEIGEVGEPFGKEQVGSSTMPQKRNPINFENIKSAWKKFMPQVVSVHLDQVSEHQRDLTNSLSQRYIPELLAMFDSSVRRANKISKKLRVDEKNMKRNFQMSADKVIAEPLQILLSFHGHPNAHEKVRRLTMSSYETGKPLTTLIFEDKELKVYLEKFTPEQRTVISDPKRYVGIAATKTRKICDYWEKSIRKWR
jgi:adenylosuccinate lyase